MAERSSKKDDIKLDKHDLGIIDQIYDSIKKKHDVPKADYYWGLIGPNKKKFKDKMDETKEKSINHSSILNDIRKEKISDERLGLIWLNSDKRWLERICHLNMNVQKNYLAPLLIEELNEYIPTEQCNWFISDDPQRDSEIEKLIAILIICRCRSYLYGAFIPEENTAITFKSDQFKDKLLDQLKANNYALVSALALSDALNLVKNILTEYYVAVKDAKDFFHNYCPDFSEILKTEAEYFFEQNKIPIKVFRGMSLEHKAKLIKNKTVIILNDFSGEIIDLKKLLACVNDNLQIVVIFNEKFACGNNIFYKHYNSLVLISPATNEELHTLFYNIVEQGNREKHSENTSISFNAEEKEMIDELCSLSESHWMAIELVARLYSHLQNDEKSALLEELVKKSCLADKKLIVKKRKFHANEVLSNTSKPLCNYISDLYEKYLPGEAQVAFQILSCAGDVPLAIDYVQKKIPKGEDALRLLMKNGWVEQNGFLIRVRLPRYVTLFPASKKELRDAAQKHVIEFAEIFLREIEGCSDTYTDIGTTAKLIYNLHDYIIEWIDSSGDDKLTNFLEKFHIKSVLYFINVTYPAVAIAFLGKYKKRKIIQNDYIFNAIEISAQLRNQDYGKFSKFKDFLCNLDAKTIEAFKSEECYYLAMILKTILDSMVYAVSFWYDDYRHIVPNFSPEQTEWIRLIHIYGNLYVMLCFLSKGLISDYLFKTRLRYCIFAGLLQMNNISYDDLNDLTHSLKTDSNYPAESLEYLDISSDFMLIFVFEYITNASEHKYEECDCMIKRLKGYYRFNLFLCQKMAVIIPPMVEEKSRHIREDICMPLLKSLPSLTVS